MSNSPQIYEDEHKDRVSPGHWPLCASPLLPQNPANVTTQGQPEWETRAEPSKPLSTCGEGVWVRGLPKGGALPGPCPQPAVSPPETEALQEDENSP